MICLVVLIVGFGDGQVDHDIDVAIGQQFVGRLCRDVEFVRTGLCRLGRDICDGAHFDPFEQGREFEVGRRDVSCAEYPDAVCFAHV